MESTHDGAQKPDPLRGPVLEAGLKAAFGSSSASDSNSRPSVVALLAKLGARAGRVLLREPRGEDEPLVKPASKESAQGAVAAGHYQVLGEIARGGIGVVLRGHDTELGRDVALKILRDDHRDNASLLERFIEEAQIGGQLQHPGIAPVYELGVSADLRPYFAMKLIKGESLAALLTRRTSPSEERRRFLGIFEQVCHTLAYAHARGVIHRDLKPANIMVGAFGEVQVVDWGLAKVLAHGGVADEKRSEQERAQRSPVSVIQTVRSRPGSSGSDSIAGSVMGTPAYMSPEQARGQVERLDERSDVFALGAILCELLTGAPPYVGERDEALAQAAAAELERAFQSLDDCDADAELVDLCKSCLAAKKQERPRSSAEVAAQTTAYLASVEERARKAQIAVAQAEVKVQEERKARKLTLALAGSVLVTIVAVGGGWTWIHNKEFTRMANMERSVRAALADAALERGAKKYVESLAAVERAKALMDAGDAQDASQALRDEVRETAAGVEAEAEAARKAAELEQGNRELLANLKKLPDPSSRVFASADGEIFPTNWTRIEADNAALFESAGLAVDSMTTADASSAIRARGISTELAAALDQWARACRVCGHDDKSARLVDVALAVDDDANRIRLRKAMLAGDVATLKSFAKETDLRALPAATLYLLGLGLSKADEYEASAEVLRVAQRAHPTDPGLTAELARRLMDLSPPRAREAVEFFRAAVALQPDSVEIRVTLGVALEDGLNDPAAAVQEFEEARRLDQKNVYVVGNLGHALADAGEVAKGIAVLEENVRNHPDSAAAVDFLGVVLRNKGDLDGAIAADRKTIALAPASPFGYTRLGHALLDKGETKNALEQLEKAIQVDAKFVEAHKWLGIARSRSNDPDGAISAFRIAIKLDSRRGESVGYLAISLHQKGRVDEAIETWRSALRLDPGNVDMLRRLGAALERAGRGEEAIAPLSEAARLKPDDVGTQNDLGIAFAMSGRFEEAIVHMREALRLNPKQLETHLNLGRSLATIGSNRKAIAEYRKAIKLDARHPGGPYGLVGILLGCPDPTLRNPVEALHLAELLTKIEPNDLGNNYILGEACCRNQQWERAVEQFEKVLKPKTEDIGGALFLAMAKHHLDADDEAREWFDKASDWLDKTPEQPPADPDEPVADSPGEARHLRAEVAALLGLDEKEPAKKPVKKTGGGR